MNRILPILALGTAIIGVSACAPEHSALNAPPGHYETNTSATTPGGTDIDKKTSANVGYDANGNKEATVQTKTTVDPPGLFNKQTTTSSETVK
jgi:hypothetical protein